MTTRIGSSRSWSLHHLAHFKYFELPYVFGNDALQLAVVAAKRTGNEAGYLVYMSLDGSSYASFAKSAVYSPSGILIAPYPEDTFQIDDDIGFTIDVVQDNFSTVSNIARSKLFGYDNLALLGDELISFQYITPVEGTTGQYKLSGIFRGRFDTKRMEHSAGTRMFFITRGRYALLTNEYLTISASRYFKLVPYNQRGSLSQDNAIADRVRLTGRAFKYYPPANVSANGKYQCAWYTDDVTLTWAPRMRSEGAGYGDPDYVTDAGEEYEGTFYVYVEANSRVVHRESNIDALTWTYEKADILSDNSSQLPSSLTFYVASMRRVGNNTLYSDFISITVRRAE